jgi:hypothetical protein
MQIPALRGGSAAGQSAIVSAQAGRVQAGFPQARLLLAGLRAAPALDDGPAGLGRPTGSCFGSTSRARTASHCNRRKPRGFAASQSSTIASSWLAP